MRGGASGANLVAFGAVGAANGWLVRHELGQLVLLISAVYLASAGLSMYRPAVLTDPSGVTVRTTFRSDRFGWDRIDRFVSVERPVTRRWALARPALRLVDGPVVLAAPSAIQDAARIVADLNRDIDWRRAHPGAVPPVWAKPRPVLTVGH